MEGEQGRVEGEVAEFLACRGAGDMAGGVCRAFRAASYPEEEWVEALIAMSAETLEELLAAVRMEQEQEQEAPREKAQVVTAASPAEQL